MRILPFFFRYYDPIVERFFIYDDGSDDGSFEYLQAHPKVTVQTIDFPGESLIEAAFQRVNQLWWPSRGEADWVVVCNVDEFFWHRDIWRYLQDCRKQGITYLQAEGYQMVSNAFPPADAELSEYLRTGARFENMDKPAFFNPNEIEESGFGIARHTCSPVGNVVRPERDELLLLHYKHMGLDYVLERHAELNERRRARDVEKRFGFHYAEDVTRERHREYVASARELFTKEEAAQARLGRRTHP